MTPRPRDSGLRRVIRRWHSLSAQTRERVLRIIDPPDAQPEGEYSYAADVVLASELEPIAIGFDEEIERCKREGWTDSVPF